MKKQIVLQLDETEVTDDQLIEKVKEIWKEKGKKIKDIENVKVYFKVSENKFYYVVNEFETGIIE